MIKNFARVLKLAEKNRIRLRRLHQRTPLSYKLLLYVGAASYNGHLDVLPAFLTSFL